jgi:RNA polymerase primary sigma factor
MDAPFVDGEDSSLLDLLVNPNAPQTDGNLVYNDSLSREIERSLSSLTDRQKEVIKLYYGIGIPHPVSLEDIGVKFSLTRERVRQIKDKGLIKLRTTSRSSLLKSYIGN